MSLPPLVSLTVAGIMSGTSADGIDVALVRIGPAPEPQTDAALTLELLAHSSFPFSPELRRAVLAAQDAPQTSTAELARLHWRLGLAYAEAYRSMLATHAAGPGWAADLVGCHGQTIYHQATPAGYAGESFACTWQIGEMAPLARAAGVPVISNFRPADMAVGGQGAPLVPLLDLALYQHPTRARVLQNIGGIGNLTVVPPPGSPVPTLAFDTGPGNMVIDELTRQLFSLPYDDGGRIAASGQAVQPVVDQLLREPFFALLPPRSAGREQFGPVFAARLLQLCGDRSPADAVATATELTARSIAHALIHLVVPAIVASETELIVSGGGAKNRALLGALTAMLTPRGVNVRLCDDPALPTPLPVEAKEAAAFALLAYMSHHRRAGNVPSATGAAQPVVLGQVTCG